MSCALLAFRWAYTGLEFMQTLNLGGKLEDRWNWGFGLLPVPDTFAPVPATSLSDPSPRRWLGPYSYEAHVKTISVLQEVVDRLTKGIMLDVFNAPLVRVPVRFGCYLDWEKEMAIHWPKGQITLHFRFWELSMSAAPYKGSRIGGLTGAAINVFHELCHYTGLVEDFNEKYGPDDALNLAQNDQARALTNIDNFAHWAAARYRYWGECSQFDPDKPETVAGSSGGSNQPTVHFECKKCLIGTGWTCKYD